MERNTMTGSGKYGHRYPHLRLIGRDDDRLYEIRRKFLRARCQARYWRQGWSLTWPQWLTLFEGVNIDQFGVRRGTINVTRINKRKGWHQGNVEIAPRSQNTHHSTKARKHTRRRRNDQLESLWQRAKAIKRQHHWGDTSITTRGIYQRLQQQEGSE